MISHFKDWVKLQIIGVKYKVKHLYYNLKLRFVKDDIKKRTHLRILQKQCWNIKTYGDYLEQYLDKYDVENWRDL